MPPDRAGLRGCADLPPEGAAEKMARALQDGRHQPAYVGRMRTVAAIDEVV